MMDDAAATSEPSVLVYARHFGLTPCCKETELLSNFDLLQSPSGPESFNSDTDEDCSQLLQCFEEAAHEHLTLVNDESLHVSKEVATFLQNSTRKADLNLHEIYQNLLPDPRRLGKHKLKIPLLLIGGGDVCRDVRRIKKGINLSKVLDDLLEDYEETLRHCRQREECSASTDPAKMLEMIQDQLEKATRTQVMEVTDKSLHYLKDVLCSSLSEKDIEKMLHQSLPGITDTVPILAKDIAEEDFELEFAIQDRNSTQHPLAVPNEIDADLPAVKQEANDILHGLDVAVDNEIPWSAHVPQIDEEMDALLKQFTNHDVEELGEQCELDGSDTIGLSEGEPPQKRRKLTHEQDDEAQDTKCPLLADASKSLTQAQSYWQARKVAVPAVELHRHCLPPADMSEALAAHQSADSQEAGPQQTLPLIVPCTEEVMRDAMPNSIRLLDRYLEQRKTIVTSDELLFKEPGLRVLDKTDTDEEDLAIEDYRLDGWKANTFMEANMRSIDEPQTYFFNRHSPRVKVEPNEQRRVSTAVASSLANAETQPATTKSEHPSPSSGQEASLPPQRFGNPFERRVADTKRELNFTEERVAGASDLRVTNNESHSTDVKGEHKAQPGESVSQLLGHMRNTKTRLPNAQSEEFNRTPCSSDSLLGFLDLRGKRFKAPPVQWMRKENEVAEDPIQSTQSSVSGQMEGATSDTSAAMEESRLQKAEAQILPPVAALDRSRTIVLNNTVLQTKPLVAQFLERTGEERLTIVYRDLDQQQERGPEMILNPCTCLVITNMQALHQRPLPGQRTSTGLSKVHDHVAVLWQRYAVVIILVHYVVREDGGWQQKQSGSMAAFTSFCQQLTGRREQPASIVVPVWVECLKAQSTSGAINVWVWQMIQHHAHETPRAPQAEPVENAPSALIQDETLWEIVLVKAGLNPMAAQLVIGSLERRRMASGTTGVADAKWGLRRLVSMEPSERHDLFDELIGQNAVDRLNRVLRG